MKYRRLTSRQAAYVASLEASLHQAVELAQLRQDLVKSQQDRDNLADILEVIHGAVTAWKNGGCN